MAKVDEIGIWSREKLLLLNEYLGAYANIMNTQRPSPGKPSGWLKAVHYIDAFAGSVTPWDKEAQEYIDGSPLVALKTVPGFDRYVFIDCDEKRLNENVAPLMKMFNGNNIELHHGDCNDVLVRDILPKFTPYGKERGFAFLDPYGLQLNWSTVEAIGKSRVFDVFINFSVMGIIRQLGDKPPCAADQQKISMVMGQSDWFHHVYQESQQLTLFDIGPQFERRSDQLAERLCELYRDQLKTCFEHVSDGVLMRNSKGGPLYALILASHAKLAKDKMHEIFGRFNRKKRMHGKS
ncbi:MAG: three-Cys-motif partner protein TcmP [Acidobacteriota bacterium]